MIWQGMQQRDRSLKKVPPATVVSRMTTIVNTGRWQWWSISKKRNCGEKKRMSRRENEGHDEKTRPFFFIFACCPHPRSLYFLLLPPIILSRFRIRHIFPELYHQNTCSLWKKVRRLFDLGNWDQHRLRSTQTEINTDWDQHRLSQHRLRSSQTESIQTESTQTEINTDCMRSTQTEINTDWDQHRLRSTQTESIQTESTQT